MASPQNFWGISWYTNASLLFCYLINPSLSSFFFLFSFFFNFWPDFHATVLRPLWALFSSNFICMEIFGCLVSNSLGLVWFGVTIVRISCLEGRWRNAKKLCDVFPLKIHIFQSKADIIEHFCWKLSKTLFFKMVQPAYSSSCPIGTVYYANSSKKLPIFPIKNLK